MEAVYLLTVLMVPDTLVEELREDVVELFDDVTDVLVEVNGELLELMEVVTEEFRKKSYF